MIQDLFSNGIVRLYHISTTSSFSAKEKHLTCFAGSAIITEVKVFPLTIAENR